MLLSVIVFSSLFRGLRPLRIPTLVTSEPEKTPSDPRSRLDGTRRKNVCRIAHRAGGRYMPAKGLFFFHASQAMDPSHSTKIMPYTGKKSRKKPGVEPTSTTGTDSSRGRPAFSSPAWVVSWKMTVPTFESLPRHARSAVFSMSGG